MHPPSFQRVDDTDGCMAVVNHMQRFNVVWTPASYRAIYLLAKRGSATNLHERLCAEGFFENEALYGQRYVSRVAHHVRRLGLRLGSALLVGNVSTFCFFIV